MYKRKLKELNLLDDFLFYTMLNHQVVGEEFARKMLKILLCRDFGKLKIVPQKVYYGTDTDKHGARLDVYLEEELSNEQLIENATIFDVEPESELKKEDKESLPKRVRFYHSKIDAHDFKIGEVYSNLKRVVVIMILPYDPFGCDRILYTIQNRCLEVPELDYDDGAKTIFLYTEGKKGTDRQELCNFLQYMKESKSENVTDETLKEIHQMVESVKRDAEVSWKYMKIWEREKRIAEEAAEAERMNTERERKRADEMEAEVKKLKEELARLKMEQKVSF